jgi:tetratricopeptide (TPR) repeat protein
VHELFRSPRRLVRGTDLPSCDRCVITFDSYSEELRFEDKGFGEEFFASRGIAAIHILSRENDWYQHEEMADIVAAIRQATRGVGRIMTYGSSMGGYAAIRFAEALGAQAALALSPQYSIDGAKVPFERRWREEGRRIRYREEVDGRIRASIRPVVAYDPTGIDRLHVERIAADVDIVRLPLPYAGHPAGTILSEARLLTPLVLETLDGTLDAAVLAGEFHVRRSGLANYFGELARRQPAGRPKLRVALARLGVALAPDHPLPLHLLAVALTNAGAHDEALPIHRRIVEEMERRPVYVLAYADALLAAGKRAEAVAMVRASVAAAPDIAWFHRCLAYVLYVHGDLTEALASARRAAMLDPANRDYRKTVRKLRALILIGRILPADPRPDSRIGKVKRRLAVRRP